MVRTLAEATLTLVLFRDASSIDLGELRRELGVPARLLDRREEKRDAEPVVARAGDAASRVFTATSARSPPVPWKNDTAFWVRAAPASSTSRL